MKPLATELEVSKPGAIRTRGRQSNRTKDDKIGYSGKPDTPPNAGVNAHAKSSPLAGLKGKVVHR